MPDEQTTERNMGKAGSCLLLIGCAPACLLPSKRGPLNSSDAENELLNFRSRVSKSSSWGRSAAAFTKCAIGEIRTIRGRELLDFGSPGVFDRLD